VTVLRAAEAMVEVTERSSPFLNLVNAFARRHARFADPTDLDTAVDSARQPVAHAEPGSVRLLRDRTTPARPPADDAGAGSPPMAPVRCRRDIRRSLHGTRRKVDARGAPWCLSGS
jgi:hypothetical protein